MVNTATLKEISKALGLGENGLVADPNGGAFLSHTFTSEKEADYAVQVLEGLRSGIYDVAVREEQPDGTFKIKIHEGSLEAMAGWQQQDFASAVVELPASVMQDDAFKAQSDSNYAQLKAKLNDKDLSFETEEHARALQQKINRAGEMVNDPIASIVKENGRYNVVINPAELLNSKRTEAITKDIQDFNADLEAWLASKDPNMNRLGEALGNVKIQRDKDVNFIDMKDIPPGQIDDIVKKINTATEGLATKQGDRIVINEGMVASAPKKIDFTPTQLAALGGTKDLIDTYAAAAAASRQSVALEANQPTLEQSGVGTNAEGTIVFLDKNGSFSPLMDDAASMANTNKAVFNADQNRVFVQADSDNPNQAKAVFITKTNRDGTLEIDSAFVKNAEGRTELKIFEPITFAGVPNAIQIKELEQRLNPSGNVEASKVATESVAVSTDALASVAPTGAYRKPVQAQKETPAASAKEAPAQDPEKAKDIAVVTRLKAALDGNDPEELNQAYYAARNNFVSKTGNKTKLEESDGFRKAYEEVNGVGSAKLAVTKWQQLEAEANKGLATLMHEVSAGRKNESDLNEFVKANRTFLDTDKDGKIDEYNRVAANTELKAINEKLGKDKKDFKGLAGVVNKALEGLNTEVKGGEDVEGHSAPINPARVVQKSSSLGTGA